MNPRTIILINLLISISISCINSSCINRDNNNCSITIPFFNNSSESKGIEELIENFVGTSVTIPRDVACQIIDSTIIYSDCNIADYKIITYIDSTGCTSCKLKLQEWNDILQEYNSIADMDFLMIVESKNATEILKLLRNNLFNYPVMIDTAKYFKEHNKLLWNSLAHTFLVDNKNKILAIGNPVINPKINALYKNIISENDEIDLYQNYLCRKPIRALGLVHHNEINKQSFCLVNRDTTCYTIQKIIPSCSCITARTYDNKIHPGRTSNIELTYVGDSVPGIFKQYVDVYYFEKERPERLTVFGYIK